MYDSLPPLPKRGFCNFSPLPVAIGEAGTAQYCLAAEHACHASNSTLGGGQALLWFMIWYHWRHVYYGFL